MENELILMSIKTKYANLIFNGTKKYEYRRKSIGDKNCNKKIYIYSSGEDKSIIGYIIVDKILKGNSYEIQELTNNHSKDIDNYFNGCKECYALHIGEYHRFNKPITLNYIKSLSNNYVMPQFYKYIKNNDSIYTVLNEQK